MCHVTQYIQFVTELVQASVMYFVHEPCFVTYIMFFGCFHTIRPC